jgi:hypothetical protein
MVTPASDFEYRLFGLDLRSAIALPELEPTACGTHDPVRIAMGDVDPPAVEGPTAHWLTQTAAGAVLTVANVGRFRIRDGCEITVDRDPAASDRNVRLYLLGSALGVLLHQRRMLPLHANATEIGGGAVAFLGASGAGKSTLAAAFHDRSSRVLSDDVCVVREAPKGFLAEVGIPRLRLWRDAVERSGRTTDRYERAFDSLDKYTIGFERPSPLTALPMRAIYLLGRNTDERFEIRRLAGVDAIQALIENTYRGGFIRTVGDSRNHFETCLRLSRQVPLFALTRPWDPARIDETIQRVEQHLDRAVPTMS